MNLPDIYDRIKAYKLIDMKKFIAFIVICLSLLFVSCADAGYVAVYDPTPTTVYYYPYPANPYGYYVPRRVYTRPTPPPRRPVVTPQPPRKPTGNTRNGRQPNTHRGGNRR